MYMPTVHEHMPQQPKLQLIARRYVSCPNIIASLCATQLSQATCLRAPDACTLLCSRFGMRVGTDQGGCAHQVGSSSPAQADDFQNGVAVGRLALDLRAQVMKLRLVRTGNACKVHLHQ